MLRRYAGCVYLGVLNVGARWLDAQLHIDGASLDLTKTRYSAQIFSPTRSGRAGRSWRCRSAWSHSALPAASWRRIESARR
ncbi:hypothetical protein HC891_02050 [Candidatus Gracilibacteria bacterium]|nr:hypothetical protein [Candidatus Gracilibacteria bacterium]